MSWDDDDMFDDGFGGYNGDPEHDMWTDYTTDMYEDTNYSGENYSDYDDDYSDYDDEYDNLYGYNHREELYDRGSEPLDDDRRKLSLGEKILIAEAALLAVETTLNERRRYLDKLEDESQRGGSRKKLKENEQKMREVREEIESLQDKRRKEQKKLEDAKRRRSIQKDNIIFACILFLVIFTIIIVFSVLFT